MRYKVGDIVGMPHQEIVGFDFLFVYGIIIDEKPYLLRLIQPPNKAPVKIQAGDMARVIVTFAGPVLLEGIG